MSPRSVRHVAIRWCAALALTACASVPTAHVGPVTSMTADGAYRCSQVGVETPTGFVVMPFRPMCLAATGDVLVVGGGAPAASGEVAVCSAAGDVRARFALGGDLVYSLALSPGGERVLAGCADGRAHVLALPSGEPARALERHGAACRAVAWSADGATLATAGLDGIVHVYTEPDGAHAELVDHSAGVECLLFTEHGLWSGARDGRVRLHRGDRLVRSYPAQHEPVVALCEHRGRVVAALRDGRLLALDPGRARVELLARVAAPFSLASGGGRLLVGVTGGHVQVP